MLSRLAAPLFCIDLCKYRPLVISGDAQGIVMWNIGEFMEFIKKLFECGAGSYKCIAVLSCALSTVL